MTLRLVTSTAESQPRSTRPRVLTGREIERLCRNDPVDDFSRIAQRVAGEVGIALRGAGIGVPKQRLHHVERDALIDEKTRKRVPQIVQPQVLQTRARGYDATETTTRDMAGR